MKRRVSSPVRDGLITGLLAATAAVAIRLVTAGPNHVERFQTLEGLTGIRFGDWPALFYSGAFGDGEIFAVLAADPFGAGPSQLILIPIYRYMRIGFSFAGWVLSGGNDTLVLPALFVVGLAAVAAVGFFAGYLRENIGGRSWWLLLNPALYIGFRGDTAEPLGILALVLVFTTSSIWASVALGVIRPSYSTALFGRWRLLFGVAVAMLIVRLVAFVIFDGSIIESADGSFAWPFYSYFARPSFAGFLILAAATITFVWGFRHKDWAWVVSALLVIMLGEIVVDNPVNAIRSAGMLPVLWAFSPRGREPRAEGPGT